MPIFVDEGLRVRDLFICLLCCVCVCLCDVRDPPYARNLFILSSTINDIPPNQDPSAGRRAALRGQHPFLDAAQEQAEQVI